MSHYTLQLRNAVNQFLDDAGLERKEENWPGIWERLGLADYPIYDESHRDELNMKIVRRYYMREIGLETFGLFKFYLRAKMMEIMPYYNRLYKVIDQDFNPLSNWNMTYTEDWTVNTDRLDDWSNKNSSNTDSDSTSNDTNDNRNIFQDTPMGMLDNPGSNPISNLEYATTVTYDHGSGSTTSHSDSNSSGTASGTSKRDNDEIGEKKSTEVGYKNITFVDLMKKYMDAIIDVDLMVLDDLHKLFMGIA